MKDTPKRIKTNTNDDNYSQTDVTQDVIKTMTTWLTSQTL